MAPRALLEICLSSYLLGALGSHKMASSNKAVHQAVLKTGLLFDESSKQAVVCIGAKIDFTKDFSIKLFI